MMIQPVAFGAVRRRRQVAQILAILRQARCWLFDIPTMTEAGYPITYDSYYFVLAPAGTPPDVVARLNSEFNAVLKDPSFQPILDKLQAQRRHCFQPEELAVRKSRTSGTGTWSRDHQHMTADDRAP